MALALSRAGRLKPELQLTQAVREFESVLDHDQKEQYSSYSREVAPGIGAPLALTYVLDSNRNGRRCLGPRALNILQSTQQFSAAIDVFIGGAQNILASSIWGIVKLSLIIGSNYAHYFDKVSYLLMETGRVCPQFQEFGSLYLESKSLHNLICEYFAAVINLCKHIILFSRKSFITQLPALVMPFDSQFKGCKEDLLRLARAIHEEVSLAASRTQKQEVALNSTERKENSIFRALATKDREQRLIESKRAIARQKRLELLNKLSRYDYNTGWRQARSKGNVKWILDDQTYKTWKHNSATRTAVLEGKLGSGKTVLMASVVADVTLNSNVGCAAYFFCRFDDAASLSAETIVGSLSRQLISSVDFPAPQDVDEHLSADKVLDLVSQALLLVPNRQHFVCVDGLDDCDSSEREKVLHFLWQLSHTSTIRAIKILYSIRPNNRQSTSRFLPLAVHISISTLGHKMEIEKYIRQTLEEFLEKGDMVLGDPGLVLRIQEALRAKADGMYLWVYFQLQALQEQSSDEEIVEALESLPQDMHATYLRVLKRIMNILSSGPRIFRIIAAAARPLSMEELREVLSIEPGDPNLRANMLINDISKTITQGGGSFLIVDEQDFTVRFTHESVRQFFIGGVEEGSQVAKYRVNMTAASLDLGLRCVTYLNLGVFDTQIAKQSDTAAWKAVTPLSIAQASMANNKLVTKVALSLLKGPKHTTLDVSKQLEQISAAKKTFPELTYVFLEYAKSFVFLHTKSLLVCDQITDSLFHKTFNGFLPFVPRPWPGNPQDCLGMAACEWAIQNEHFGIIHRYIRSQSLVPSTSLIEKRLCVPDDTVQAMFRFAFQSHKNEVLDFLFQKVIIGHDIQLSLMWPAIAFETILLKLNLVEILQSVDISLMRQTGTMQEYGLNVKPLKMRVVGGRELQILEFDQQWDVLTLSAACNSLKAVSFFLEAGILKNLHSEDAANLLLLGLREAACRGFSAIFQVLYARFPDDVRLDSFCDQHGWNAFGYAATLSDCDTFGIPKSNASGAKADLHAYHPSYLANLARINGRKVWVSPELRTGNEAVAELSSENEIRALPHWMESLRGRESNKEADGSSLLIEALNGMTDSLLPTSGLVMGSPAELSAESEIKALPEWVQRLEKATRERKSHRKADDSVSACDTEYDPAESLMEGRFSPLATVSPRASLDSRSSTGVADLTEGTHHLETREDQPSPDEVEAAIRGFDYPPPPRIPSPLRSFYGSPNRLEWKKYESTESAIDSQASDTRRQSTSMTPPSFHASEIRRRRRPSTSIDKPPKLKQPWSPLNSPFNQNHLMTARSSKPRPTAIRARPMASKVRSRVDPQAQMLRAQAAAIKAQVSLVEACRPKTDRKVWWENPLLVFVVFIFWPLIILFCFVYMLGSR